MEIKKLLIIGEPCQANSYSLMNIMKEQDIKNIVAIDNIEEYLESRSKYKSTFPDLVNQIEEKKKLIELNTIDYIDSPKLIEENKHPFYKDIKIKPKYKKKR